MASQHKRLKRRFESHWKRLQGLGRAIVVIQSYNGNHEGIGGPICGVWIPYAGTWSIEHPEKTIKWHCTGPGIIPFRVRSARLDRLLPTIKAGDYIAFPYDRRNWG